MTRSLRYEPLERREVLTAALGSSLALFSDQGSVIARDIAHDAQGNTYLTGHLDASQSPANTQIDLDPLNTYADNHDIFQTTITSAGFIAKYDVAGNFQWVRGPGPRSGGTFKFTELEFGSQSGLMYFAGRYQQSQGIEFGGLSLPGIVIADFFAGAIDADGDVAWLKAVVLPGTQFPNANEPGGALAVDEVHQRVFIAGQQMLTNPGQRSGIVAALNVSNPGNVTLVWSTTLAASTEASCRDIEVDSTGAVYVGGYIRGTADFDPSNAKANFSSGSGQNAPGAGYLWKLSPTGAYQWAKVFEGSSTANSAVGSVAVDGSNSVYVAGGFGGNVDFLSGKGTFNLPNDGSAMFLLKFNSSGGLVASSSFNEYSGSAEDDITIGPAGTILIAGKSDSGGYIAQFDANLHRQWQVFQVGATILPKLSYDAVSGTLHVLGSFVGALDADGDGDTELLDPSATYDLYWLTFSLS